MINPPPSSVPSVATSAQRRQRNALIGLGVGSGLVLLIGIVAAVLTRDPGSTSVPTTFSTVVTTTVPAPSTVATTSTVVTTTTVPTPVSAVADAGPDLVVSAGDVVTLSALEVTEGAEDESIIWRQTAGPDVTAGVGALGGRDVSFGAPADVVTVEFELVVTSGERAATAPEAVDALVVRVFEDAEALLFVDGERGDDAAVGSMDAPLRTIGAAALAAEGRDIYVRSAGDYTENATIRLGPGTSLYAGFDADWNRDRSQRARLQGGAVAIVVQGDGDRTIGSIELTAAGAAPGQRSVGIRVVDGETVTLADSRILAGAGGEGTADADAGVSVGVVAVGTGELRIERSTVNASDGGRGTDGVAPEPGAAATAGGDGGDADQRDAGEGADGEGVRRGGDGGRGGSTSDGDDAPGGGAGGDSADRDGEPGRGGAGGAGGVGGDGGQGLVDDDGRTAVGAPGSTGGSGEAGAGGSGGGGGFGPLAVRGGGGGGGGAGGEANSGGAPGGGGAGSIGVWAVDVARVVVDESLVAAGRGGAGGSGAPAEQGGRGGDGGFGAEGEDGFIIVGDGGRGGGAGGGGAGGAGGHGGGGAGGPSYGMLTSGVDDIEVRASTIRGGAGGAGADGGIGGNAGGDGGDGSGRSGGDGGSAGAGEPSAQGAGASGGSSYGWFDVDDARQTFVEAAFIEGTAGPGGAGSSRGDDGAQTAANVDAE
jgi:hypothetical protein